MLYSIYWFIPCLKTHIKFPTKTQVQMTLVFHVRFVLDSALCVSKPGQPQHIACMFLRYRYIYIYIIYTHLSWGGAIALSVHTGSSSSHFFWCHDALQHFSWIGPVAGRNRCLRHGPYNRCSLADPPGRCLLGSQTRLSQTVTLLEGSGG